MARRDDRRDSPRGLSPVRDGLDRVLRHLRAPAARHVKSVFELWPTVVGAQLAAHTSVGALRDGELVVDVDDPAWANQLRWLESELVRRLADEIGDDVVRTIRFRVRGKG